MLKQVFTQPVFDKVNYDILDVNVADFGNEIFGISGVTLRVGYGGNVFYKVSSMSEEVEIPHEALARKLVSFIKKNIDKPRGVCGFFMHIKSESVECWNDNHNYYWKCKI